MKLPYNKKLLHEDLKFPLIWDTEEYKMYIFDSENRMVAQVNINIEAYERPWAVEHPFTKILGEYKEVEPNTNNFKLEGGAFIDSNNDSIGWVRGWGRLQYLKSPKGEKRLDNISKYILNVLNYERTESSNNE